jgi:Rho termination factor, N-terminal domain
MPSWTKKDWRQYEHIKEGLEQQGQSDVRSKEIAGRTVNKQRRREGRTPSKHTQGTGNPNKALEARTADELRNLASQFKVPGRSKMRKADLVNALRNKV